MSMCIFSFEVVALLISSCPLIANFLPDDLVVDHESKVEEEARPTPQEKEKKDESSQVWLPLVLSSLAVIVVAIAAAVIDGARANVCPIHSK